MSFDVETGRDVYFAALAREVAELVDPATGKLSESFARLVDCPLCGSADHRALFEKSGYTFVRCAVCSLVFANPQVDPARVVERYRGMHSAELWAEVLLSDRQQALDRRKFEEILDLLEPFRGGGRLLDVGCSIGLFLELARAREWDGIGIEFGRRAPHTHATRSASPCSTCRSKTRDSTRGRSTSSRSSPSSNTRPTRALS